MMSNLILHIYISLPATTYNFQAGPNPNQPSRPIRPRLLRHPHRPPARRAPLRQPAPHRPDLLAPTLDGPLIRQIRPDRLLSRRRDRHRLHELLPAPRLVPRPARALRPAATAAHQPDQQTPVLDRPRAGAPPRVSRPATARKPTTEHGARDTS